jgi:hypothetical protein
VSTPVFPQDVEDLVSADAYQLRYLLLRTSTCAMEIQHTLSLGRRHGRTPSRTRTVVQSGDTAFRESLQQSANGCRSLAKSRGDISIGHALTSREHYLDPIETDPRSDGTQLDQLVLGGLPELAGSSGSGTGHLLLIITVNKQQARQRIR